MKKSITATLALAMMALVTLPASARQEISFNNDWHFAKRVLKARGVFPNITMPKADEVVNLPHTYNADDFLSDEGYYRGAATYVKELELKAEDKGKRFFLKFEGAGEVADIFVNQRYAGSHKGSYTTFTVEITDLVGFGGKNSIYVYCDNAHRFDLAPQGGDFNHYGGLYRDVWLEVMDESACISPLYYGSNGVFIKQKALTDRRADLTAEIRLSTKTDYKDCEVVLTIEDAAGQTVAEQHNPYINNDMAICNVDIENPHRWNGVKDPYLYKVIVKLCRGGKEIDRVEDHIGLRDFYIDENKGFFLNGKHVKLRGVSRHQDWAKKGSALTKEEHLADYDMFDEMGLNSLRLAHYPQAKFMFEEGDRRGYLIWEEIPFVGGYVASKDFDDNLKQQLREMILQNYNHPSIFCWGLFNEIVGDFDRITSELNNISHELDPYRLTAAATYQEGTFNFISDIIAWNKYFGWYYGHFADCETFFDEWHKAHPYSKIGISEYGAGASINTHVAKVIEAENPRRVASSRNHPEELQTAFHIQHIKSISERDYIWGSYVWNMFDFASAFRKEGDANNINDKGLVTHDRQTRKDAFYLYKANWNKQEKTTHLCSKRYTQRKEDVTDIVVFTTAPSAKLYINGKAVAQGKTDAYATIQWNDVKLNKGRNLVEVKTAHGSDSAEWYVE